MSRCAAECCFGLLAAYVALASACAGDGHFTLLGYSSRPNYDTKYRTMRIPMIKSRSQFVVTPVVGMEHDLHRALIAQVPLRTPVPGHARRRRHRACRSRSAA